MKFLTLDEGREICRKGGKNMKEGMEELAMRGLFEGISRIACFDTKGYLFLDMY